MNSLNFFIPVIFFISIFLFSLNFYKLIYRIFRRLKRFEFDKKYLYSLISKVNLSDKTAFLLNQNYLKKYFNTSGLDKSINFDFLIRLKLVIMYLAFLLSGIIILMGYKLFYSLILLFIGYFIVDTYLKKLSDRRRDFVSMTLPLVIDSLKMQVISGLNLEQAIKNITVSRRDLWKEEFNRVLFEYNTGIDFTTALMDLSLRFDSQDLSRFVQAVRQAKRMGASLGGTLSIQSEGLRIRRLQFAEENARLASVKIIFPLVLFIFPALLIIYIAPAVMQVLKLG